MSATCVTRRSVIAAVGRSCDHPRVTEPVLPENMRISDVERGKVQDSLRRAHDIGQLDLGEFDERVRSVWAARTRGELERVTADLPALPPEPGRRTVFSDTGGGIAMRVLTIIWSSLTMVSLSIWGLIALNTGSSLWLLWMALPPGLVLLVLYLAGIGRPRRS